jgi:nucleotide-binding universal stress UspA family protein
MEIKRILFPTDFSQNSEYAFLYALALARTFASKLYLLHVVYFPPQMPEFDIGRVLDGLVKSAEKNLKKLIQKTAETQVIFHPEVRVGAEYHEITKLAEKEKIDLIVMGTQGRTGLAHAFLGSVAERVVRYAPCPVLTVKPPKTKGAKSKNRKR